MPSQNAARRRKPDGVDLLWKRAALDVVGRFKAELAQEQAKKASGGGGAADAIVDCPDPVVFCTDWLGLEPWPRQAEILESVAEHPRVVVRSGRKTGKSTSAAALALWWAKTQPLGRVVFTAPTARQVEEIVWREVVLLYNRAAQRGKPLGGRLYRRPDGGLRYEDGREIVGFSTDQAEKFQGWSGRLLFIVDEASGVSDAIFEAIFGNVAGGGSIFKEGDERKATEDVQQTKVAAFGNPTRTSGKFFRAFREPKESVLWHPIRVSSEEAAAYQSEVGKKIGALATYAYVEDMQKAYGAESPFFYVHVKGEFALHAEGHLISISAIDDARERWLATVEVLNRYADGVDLASASQGFVTVDLYRAFEQARRKCLTDYRALPDEEKKLVKTLAQPLTLGVDVAWSGTDLSTIAPRRGDFLFPLLVLPGSNGPALALEVARAVRALRFEPAADRGPFPDAKREVPRVKIDAIGVGASCYDAAKTQYAAEMKAVAVVVSEKATDAESDTLRDQVWCATRDFLRDGGMLPPDDLLIAELQAPEYGPSSRGKLKVDDKDKIKAKLPEGRSPDRADAVCLSVYEAPVFVVGASNPEFDPWG